MADILLKIHASYRQVVSICDKELLGKTLEQGNRIIEIKHSFFKGEEKTEAEILKAIEIASAEDSTFNIVGKKSVATALKAGIIKQEGIKKIQKIPLALGLL